VVGNELQEMVSSFKAGDVAKAASFHQNLLPIMKELFAAPNPTPVKTALQMKGLDVGPVRLPLLPLSENERNNLNFVLNARRP
jgi:4-hydroxy-tetrahydrodipicolinate synthase